MTPVLLNPEQDASFTQRGFAVFPGAAAAGVTALLAVLERHAEAHHGGFAATLLTVRPELRALIATSVRDVLAPVLDGIADSYSGIGWGFLTPSEQVSPPS